MTQAIGGPIIYQPGQPQPPQLALGRLHPPGYTGRGRYGFGEGRHGLGGPSPFEQFVQMMQARQGMHGGNGIGQLLQMLLGGNPGQRMGQGNGPIEAGGGHPPIFHPDHGQLPFRTINPPQGGLVRQPPVVPPRLRQLAGRRMNNGGKVPFIPLRGLG